MYGSCNVALSLTIATPYLHGVLFLSVCDREKKVYVSDPLDYYSHPCAHARGHHSNISALLCGALAPPWRGYVRARMTRAYKKYVCRGTRLVKQFLQFAMRYAGQPQ